MIRTTFLTRFVCITRQVCMSSTTPTQQELLEKKLEHYKNLAALEENELKPNGWEDAKPFEDLPGPKPLPIVGNMLRFVMPKYGEFYGHDFLEIHKILYKKYGDICILKGMVGPDMVMLFNPKDFENFYRNEGVWPIRSNLPSLDQYRKSREDVVPNFGLVAHHGEPWFRIRSVVNPILMQPRNISQYTDKMNLVAAELVDNMAYLSKLNEYGEMPENFVNEIYKWSLESVAVVTLDTHLGCLKRGLEPDSEPQKMINSATQVFELTYKLDILPSAFRYLLTSDWKKFVSVMDFLIGTNIKHINKALDKLETEKDVAENEPGSVLQQLLRKDKKIAIAMAVDMLFAGVDTTGRLLSAGLYYLAQNPDKQDLLRQEAKNLLKNIDTPITKEVLAKTPYLKATIKEVCRLAPIAVGNLRKTVKNMVLAGYQIPKGTEVLTANLTLSLMDEHFTRAKEFLPERWLPTAPENLSHKTTNPFISLPFGFGPRSCIGKRLANLELEVAFLKIIRNFELSWPHEEMTFKTTTLYGISKPLKIRIKPVPE